MSLVRAEIERIRELRVYVAGLRAKIATTEHDIAVAEATIEQLKYQLEAGLREAA